VTPTGENLLDTARFLAESDDVGCSALDDLEPTLGTSLSFAQERGVAADDVRMCSDVMSEYPVEHRKALIESLDSIALDARFALGHPLSTAVDPDGEPDHRAERCRVRHDERAVAYRYTSCL
jgi:hypothetical protein